MIDLLGFIIALVLSTLTCNALNINISLENAVKLDTLFNQSSYKLYNTICGYVALRISYANFYIFNDDWNGNCKSLPLMTILGKSNKCTYNGSNIPFLVTIICFGRYYGGNARINAATYYAVFHFANCPNLFCPAHTLVWITLRNSWPVLGFRMKIAPLIGLVVRLP